VTVRNGRFVVPVKAEFSGEIPGIVHDTSSSGQTLFVEPLESLEANNRVRALRVQEEVEVARILAELSSLVGAESGQVAVDIDVYVDVDLGRRARHDRSPHAGRRAGIDGRRRDPLVDARHPLLDERAVPQSIRLDDEIRILNRVGPEHGGKDRHPQARRLGGGDGGLRDARAGRRGDDRPFRAGLHGHRRRAVDRAERLDVLGHLRRLAEIVDAANDRTLILIDEIGSGTEPKLGRSARRRGARTVLAERRAVLATTHATELKLFGADHPFVANASVRFDPDTYEPTYQLDVGSPGQSLAFALARRMHLDPHVVARAEALLSTQERDYERALAEVAEERIRATREREQLDRERQHLRSLEDNARPSRRDA